MLAIVDGSCDFVVITSSISSWKVELGVSCWWVLTGLVDYRGYVRPFTVIVGCSLLNILVLSSCLCGDGVWLFLVLSAIESWYVMVTADQWLL